MARPKKRPDRIRWKEGEHYRSYQPRDQEDAERFKRELAERKKLGRRVPSIRESQRTLVDFVEREWWPRHVARLGDNTKRVYREVWTAHIHDRIGHEPLAHIDMQRVELFRDDMDADGVSATIQIKAMNMLSSMMKRACALQLVPTNPVREVKKPLAPVHKPIRPLSPLTVEQIRQHMMQAWQSEKRGAGRTAEALAWYRCRNAMMVSLLAYTGMRPSEMERTVWDDIAGERLHVKDVKRGRVKRREIDLLPPVVLDLAEWRMRCGRPGGKELIIPTYDGDGWRKHDWDNWRSRVYHPAARVAGVHEDDSSPYHLRHSFISLLLWAGEDGTYVAEQAGHSLRTQHDHYAGFMRELRGKPKVSAAEAIRQAREELSGGSLRRVSGAE